MKTVTLLLAAALLTGCVAPSYYPAPTGAGSSHDERLAQAATALDYCGAAWRGFRATVLNAAAANVGASESERESAIEAALWDAYEASGLDYRITSDAINRGIELAGEMFRQGFAPEELAQFTERRFIDECVGGALDGS